MTKAELTCGDCGHEMNISSGPNRTRRYRGEDGYVIPAALSFAECANCGAQWLTDPQIDELSASLEGQRLQRMLARTAATKRTAKHGHLVSFTTSGNAGGTFVKVKRNVGHVSQTGRGIFISVQCAQSASGVVSLLDSPRRAQARGAVARFQQVCEKC